MFSTPQILIVLCCPANPETNSATLRYIIREHGADAIFRLRPAVGDVVTLPTFLVNGQLPTIHLLVTRSTPRCPMLADTLFAFLEQLNIRLEHLDATTFILLLSTPNALFVTFSFFTLG